MIVVANALIEVSPCCAHTSAYIKSRNTSHGLGEPISVVAAAMILAQQRSVPVDGIEYFQPNLCSVTCHEFSLSMAIDKNQSGENNAYLAVCFLSLL